MSPRKSILLWKRIDVYRRSVRSFMTIVSKARLYNVEMSNVCFLMDCPRDQIWRKELLPSYKECRIKSSGFDPNAFNQQKTSFYRLSSSKVQTSYLATQQKQMISPQDWRGVRSVHPPKPSSLREIAISLSWWPDQSKFTTLARHAYSRSKLFDPKVALLRKNSFWRQVG
jgi:hypothetical protein